MGGSQNEGVGYGVQCGRFFSGSPPGYKGALDRLIKDTNHQALCSLMTTYKDWKALLGV